MSLIENLSSTYSIDADRIYASGYSNGGFMSYSLVCYHSDIFAGIGAVSSTMLNASEREDPVGAALDFSAGQGL